MILQDVPFCCLCIADASMQCPISVQKYEIRATYILEGFLNFILSYLQEAASETKCKKKWVQQFRKYVHYKRTDFENMFLGVTI